MFCTKHSPQNYSSKKTLTRELQDLSDLIMEGKLGAEDGHKMSRAVTWVTGTALTCLSWAAQAEQRQ